MAVDDQLSDFENRLSAQLQYALFVNININYWEELDELDQHSIQVMSDIVHDIYAPLLHAYRETPVARILHRSRELTHWALLTAMNVPFPRDPVLHVHRVVHNVLHTFIQTTYAALRTEMIMTDHNVQLIQRNWRQAITNPARPPCRRRLLREFENMVLCTPTGCQTVAVQ